MKSFNVPTTYRSPLISAIKMKRKQRLRHFLFIENMILKHQGKEEMDNTVEKLKLEFITWQKEDDKFSSGNSAAGTRARKSLAEMSKLIKARRNEITAEKNARKASKSA